MNPFAWTLDLARAALTPPGWEQLCADCAHPRANHHELGTNLLALAVVYATTGVTPGKAAAAAVVQSTRCARCVCKAFRPPARRMNPPHLFIQGCPFCGGMLAWFPGEGWRCSRMRTGIAFPVIEGIHVTLSGREARRLLAKVPRRLLAKVPRG